MSIMASLDSISKEYFEMDYECLSKYQKQLVNTLYELEDEPNRYTDLLIK